MIKSKIKLIIVDYYGVLTLGSYKDTCRWLAKKYKMDFSHLYDIVYHKYFSPAALGKITERQSFELPVKELGLKESWRDLRKKHLSFQKKNTPVFNYILKLQEAGFIILLLSKNTPGQFNETLKKMETRKYFKNIINSFDLKLPKASDKTIKYVLKKFKVRAEEAIMIDDQDFNLVEANKLGVKTIYYKNFKQFKRELDSYLKA
ncbi:MAG: HAD hydrolase-like protein [Patescibacteria group bacterium]|nr:HAD hydrolase-like protein [Patescibacteria group bacterium]